jgi:hypothetical protein
MFFIFYFSNESPREFCVAFKNIAQVGVIMVTKVFVLVYAFIYSQPAIQNEIVKSKKLS